MEVPFPRKHQQKHITPYLRLFLLEETENSAHFFVKLSCNVHIDDKRILTFTSIKSISFDIDRELRFYTDEKQSCPKKSCSALTEEPRKSVVGIGVDSTGSKPSLSTKPLFAPANLES